MRLPEVSDETSSKLGDLLNSVSSQLPGIDEAMSFSQLMEQVQNMEYDVVVFDTAPTGHTLRLLSFPTIIEKSLDSINSLKSSMGNMLSQITSLLGNQGPSLDDLMDKFSVMKETIHKVSLRFKNPAETTFVCVCIPEFLSVYETERLVQQLSKYGINVNSVVINQVGREGGRGTEGGVSGQGLRVPEVHRAAEDAGQVHHAGVRSVRGLPYLAGAAADGRSARRGEHSGVLADAGGGVQSGGAWGNVGSGMECLLNETRMEEWGGRGREW